MTRIDDILRGDKELRLLYAEVAGVLIHHQQYSKSVHMLTEALATYGAIPENWEIYYLLGYSYQKLNRPKESFQYFVLAAFQHPERKDELVDTAITLISASSASEIQIWLTDQLESREKNKLSDDSIATLHQLLDRCDRQLHPDAAGIELESLVIPDPEVERKLQEAQSLIDQEKYTAALSAIEIALLTAPASQELLFAKIRALVEGQLDLQMARALLDDASKGYLLQHTEKQIADVLYDLVAREKVSWNTYFFAAFVGLRCHIPAETITAWIEKAEELRLKTENDTAAAHFSIVRAEFADRYDRSADANQFYIEAAKDYYYRGQYKEAAYYFSIVTNRQPDHADAFRYLADVYFITSFIIDPPYNDEATITKAHDTWHAVRTPQVINRREDAWHYVIIARIHEVLYKFHKKDFAQDYWLSVNYLERAILYNDRDATNWTYLGRYLRNLGLERNAWYCFEKAAQINPADFLMQEEKVIVQLNTGQYDLAREMLEKWQSESNGINFRPYHKTWLGYIYFHTKRRPEAVAIFESAISELNTDLFAHQMLMFCHWYDKQLPLAREAANRILELKSRYIFLKETFTFSWAYFITGNATKAIEELSAYADPAHEMNDERFSRSQFHLYVDRVDANDLADSFLRLERNERILNEFMESNDALLYQFEQDHSDQADQVQRIKNQIATWKAQVNEIKKEPTNMAASPIEEISLKRLQYNIQPNSIADITMRATIARIDRDNNNRLTAYSTYGELVKTTSFHEASIAINQMEEEMLTESRKAIAAAKYTDSLTALTAWQSDDRNRNAAAAILQSIAHFHLQQESASQAALLRAFKLAEEEISVEQLIRQEIKSNFSDVRNNGRYLNFVLQLLDSPSTGDYSGNFNARQNQILDVLLNSELSLVPIASPIAVELSSNIIPQEAYSNDWFVITKLIPEMRDRLLRDFGISLPFIRFRPNENIGPNSYIILLNDLPTVLGNGQIDQYPEIIAHLERVIIEHMELYLDVEFVISWLTSFEKNATSTASEKSTSFVERITQNQEELITLIQVLRNLLHELVPISDKETIINTFFDHYSEGDEASELTQIIRSNLKPQLPVNKQAVTRLPLPDDAEQKLLEALRTDQGKVFLSIIPKSCQEVLDVIRLTLQKAESNGGIALITKSDTLRPHLKKLTEFEFPKVIVSSQAEVLETTTP